MSGSKLHPALLAEEDTPTCKEYLVLMPFLLIALAVIYAMDAYRAVKRTILGRR